MKFEKYVYCAYCGRALTKMNLETIDDLKKDDGVSYLQKGSHIMKVEAIATCHNCDRSSTNIFNNQQDFKISNMNPVVETWRTSDPVHDVIQAEANPPKLCAVCGGSMPQGYCAACRAIGV